MSRRRRHVPSPQQGARPDHQRSPTGALRMGGPPAPGAGLRVGWRRVCRGGAPSAGMSVVPLDELAAPRRALVGRGCDSAAEVVATVFPPRAEDSTGALALTMVEMLANQQLRHHTAQLADQRQQRLWWLEGFVLGFVAAATEALDAAALHDELTTSERLDDMESHVMSKIGGKQAVASDLVFALTRAVHSGDPLALEWALEGVWARPGEPTSPAPGPAAGPPEVQDDRPGAVPDDDGAAVDGEQVGETAEEQARAEAAALPTAATELFLHYRRVLTSAIHLACASWQLYLTANE